MTNKLVNMKVLVMLVWHNYFDMECVKHRLVNIHFQIYLLLYETIIYFIIISFFNIKFLKMLFCLMILLEKFGNTAYFLLNLCSNTIIYLTIALAGRPSARCTHSSDLRVICSGFLAGMSRFFFYFTFFLFRWRLLFHGGVHRNK